MNSSKSLLPVKQRENVIVSMETNPSPLESTPELRLEDVDTAANLVGRFIDTEVQVGPVSTDDRLARDFNDPSRLREIKPSNGAPTMEISGTQEEVEGTLAALDYLRRRPIR